MRTKAWESLVGLFVVSFAVVPFLATPIMLAASETAVQDATESSVGEVILVSLAFVGLVTGVVIVLRRFGMRSLLARLGLSDPDHSA